MPKIINENEVFKAVLEVLVDRGYEGATTLMLAAAAGMHEATLFRKYGSKVALVERAIENQLSTAPLSMVRYTGNLESDLREVLDAYAATNEAFGQLIPVLLLEIPRHPELRNALQTPLANIQGIAAIISRYQAEGVLKDEPPFTSVNALIAPVLLSEMIRRTNIGLPAPELDLHDHVAAFLNGRKRSPAAD